MKLLFLAISLIFGKTIFCQAPEVLWHYDINDMSFGNSAAEDIDNDGKLEIAFSTYRNDGMLHVLNAEDGSVVWTQNIEGCGDVAPLIHDVDKDGDFEIILPGSCNPVTYCFDADTGYIQWETETGGSDSPPTIGDIDNDGQLEILHGQFNGSVLCINAEDGSVSWELEIDAYASIQTEPTLLDVNGDGQLDFVVATWSYGDNHKIFCFNGNTRELIWETDAPEDLIYHGVAYGDLENDGSIELKIGDYSGNLYCLDSENGNVHWDYKLPSGSLYIGAPTSLADLDNNGKLDVIFCDYYHLAAVNDEGELLWNYSIPEYATAFRGASIADVNDDAFLDVTFGTSAGLIISLDGMTGEEIQSYNLAEEYGADFDINHGCLIADFNGDGTLDVFTVGGHAEYPDIENNYGRAYLVSWGHGNGPDWKMFRRDYRRSACVCNDSLLTDTVSVDIENEILILQGELIVSPNPMIEKMNVSFTLNENAAVTLFVKDVLGNEVYVSQTMNLPTGMQYITLNRKQLFNTAPGIYLLELHVNRQIFSHSFMMK